MTAREVKLDRVHARYRLPASARATRERLDRVLADMLDHGLEPELERRLPPDELVCVRAVDVALRIRLSAGDSELVAAWSAALAEAIERAAEDSKPGVVRYRSRRHAVADLVGGGATGALERAWAWHGLGLWPAREGDGPVTAAATVREAALGALLAGPEDILPVLRALAGTRSFARVATLFGAEGWRVLAASALTAAGAQPSLAAPGTAPAHDGGERPAPAADETAGVPARAGAESPGRDAAAPATSAVARSLLARAALSAAVDSLVAPPQPRAALAALVALEREPARLAGDDVRARALVDAVAGELLARAGLAPGPVRRKDESGTPVPGDARPGAEQTDAVQTAGRTEPGAVVEPVDSERSAPDGTTPGERTADAMPEPESESELELDAALPRTSGRTDAAGLLFLLHVVDELGLPEELIVAEPLGFRPFRWTLHALALALAPVEPDDPAALAFAGLGPEDEAPSVAEEPPTEAETAALAAHAERIAERLHERLERPEEPADEVLASVRARRGEIVADPGWLEVHLSLDDVDLDLRRAGLDLDPGWIPWLGVVVRFVYE